MRWLVPVLSAALALAASPGQAEPYRALPRLAPAQVQHRKASATRVQRALTHGQDIAGPTVPALEPAPPADVAEEAGPAEPAGPLAEQAIPGPAAEPAQAAGDPADAPVDAVESPVDAGEAPLDAPIVVATNDDAPEAAGAGPDRTPEGGAPADAPAQDPAGAAPADAPGPAAVPAEPGDSLDDGDLRRDDDDEDELRRTSSAAAAPLRLAEAELTPAPEAATIAAVREPAPADAPARPEELAVSAVTAQGDGTYAMVIRTSSGDHVAIVLDDAGRLLRVTGAPR